MKDTTLLTLNLTFPADTYFLLKTEDKALLRTMKFDFQSFASEVCTERCPQLECRGSATPVIPSTARLVSRREHYQAFNHNGSRWISYYNGRAVLKWDFQTNCGILWCQERKLMVETCFLTILAVVAQALDRKGYHRIHASAVSVNGKAVVCSMDSGCGKTTLMLSATSNKLVHFLSDDCPLISRSGKIHSFPLSIGNREEPGPEVSTDFIQQRVLESGERKWMINTGFFPDRIASKAVPKLLLLGERSKSPETSLESANMFAAASIVFRNLIMAKGLRQGPEIILRHDGFDWARITRMIVSRTIAAAALLLRTKTSHLRLGTDRSQSIACYREVVTKLQ